MNPEMQAIIRDLRHQVRQVTVTLDELLRVLADEQQKEDSHVVG